MRMLECDDEVNVESLAHHTPILAQLYTPILPQALSG